MAQFGRIVTAPICFVPAIRRARIRWDMAAHPAKKELISINPELEARKQLLLEYIELRKTRRNK